MQSSSSCRYCRLTYWHCGNARDSVPSLGIARLYVRSLCRCQQSCTTETSAIRYLHKYSRRWKEYTGCKMIPGAPPPSCHHPCSSIGTETPWRLWPTHCRTTTRRNKTTCWCGFLPMSGKLADVSFHTYSVLGVYIENTNWFMPLSLLILSMKKCNCTT